jgi:hypothetical protein
MTPPNPDAFEEQFGFLLGAYDEALAEGQDPATRPERLNPELRTRLQRAEACLRLLEARRRVADPLDPRPQAGSASSPGAAGTVPGRFGRFRIERELGRGGCGVVFLAFDPVLRRQVALKIPHLHTVAQPELRQRFLREAQAAGSLDHPGIVPLYETGEVGGVAYLASAYCPGPSLAGWLKAQSAPVPVRQAAELVVMLAEAVAYTHGRGILHRDVKPGNVLLQEKEGAWVAGTSLADTSLPAFTPRLTDFGLAKLTDQGTRQTATGAVLGTPAYMAPEQAEGRLADVGPQTDVYALGVLLYEVLTGKAPFQGAAAVEVLHRVSRTEPDPPHRYRRDVPRDLETICLKCLEKEPRKRYASARDLADELSAWLAGKPIRARPTGVGRRALRWARRHPALLTAVVMLSAFLAFLAVRAPKSPEPRADAIQTEPTDEGPWDRSTLIAARRLTAAEMQQVSAPDQPLLLTAWGPYLYELAPRSERQRLRFRVEVRHESSRATPYGDVGAYFGFHEVRLAKGVAQCFGTLSFRDQVQPGWAKLNDRGEKGSWAELNLHRHATPGLMDNYYLQRYWGHHFYFPPDGGPSPWRELSLEVTPECIAARWDGAPLRALTPTYVARFIEGQLARSGSPLPVPEQAVLATPVGIYLNGASASIRNVRIESVAAGPGPGLLPDNE